MNARIVELTVESPVDRWRELGLHIDDDGVAQIGGVRLRFVPGDRGVVGWGLDGSATAATDIDGLATTHVAACDGEPHPHPLRVLGFDHVVVMTSSLERTCGAIEAATGAELRRIREAGPVRQGFHRLGEVIVEVVESERFTLPTAAFWGFVWNVEDLYAACDHLGPERVGLPKSAVQSGRFIATVRSAAAPGVALALMTPR
ncbi:MAG: glyoxalase [Ilumatobacteraceae bacterium]